MSILDWTQRSESFDGIALYQGRRLTLTDSAGPQRLSGLRVSNGYFEIMQVTPYLRRFFGPAEFHEGGDAVVVLAYDFGKRHFQSDRSVVGKTIPLNYRPWTLIGVAPLCTHCLQRRPSVSCPQRSTCRSPAPLKSRPSRGTCSASPPRC